MNLGCTQQIESKLSLHSLARDLRLFVGWRIEDISCNSTFMKFCYCSLGEGLPMGIPYCSFSPFLFPIAVSLCACRHSNGGYFLNILPFTGAK
jgi:hypothetical protein